jgi:hypothetical protein
LPVSPRTTPKRHSPALNPQPFTFNEGESSFS